MNNNVVDINNLTDETKQKLRDFDEQEAYFLLCEIFANAQASKDYTKFQTDLAEWKKHYPIDLFSEDLKRKIKYMLSKEFLDTILKNFTVFDELSKKDPAVGLEKLRKALNKAEKHKDKKQLDKDLDNLYKEYPLDFLKEKYPHIVNLLISQANIDKVLQKFDSDLAYDELTKITEHPEDFKNFDEYKKVLEEYKKNFPIDDFSDKYKSQVQTILDTNLDEKIATQLFSISYLDLSDGEVVDLNLPQNFSLLECNARTEFFKIVDNDINNIPALYDWTCKYAKYINSFDTNTKNTIVSSLLKRYYHELPTLPDYRIPELTDFDNDLSLEDSINDINKMKKDTVIQLLGILSTGNVLTTDDCRRINSNNKQVKEIEVKSIDYELFNFMENKKEDELTFDKDTSLYLNSNSSSSVSGGASLMITQEDDSTPKISVQENEPDTIQSIQEPEHELKVKCNLDTSLNQATSQEPSPNDIEVTAEVNPELNQTKINEYKKDSTFGKIWNFLNKDISNKRKNDEIERDYDER